MDEKETKSKRTAKSTSDASKTETKSKAQTEKKTAAAASSAKSKPAAPKATKDKTAEIAIPAEKKKTAAKKSETAKESKPTAQKVAAPVKEEVAATKETKPLKEQKTNEDKKNAPKKSVIEKIKSFASTKKGKIRIIITAAVSLLLVVAIILGVVLGTKSCSNNNSGNNGGNTGENPGGDIGNNGDIVIPKPNNPNYTEGDLKPGDPYYEVSTGIEHYFNPGELPKYEYDTDKKTNTIVGYSAQQIGTVERKIPTKTRDEGLGAYPKFGYTLSTVIGSDDDKIAARNALIAESSYLTATGTWNAGGGNYTWMDKDGFLYSGTTAEPVPTLDKFEKHRRLYKHSASQGLYFGDVDPAEPGIIKEVTMRPRGYNGYGVTGVYAPAGEVIKIQISEADMNATGGLEIHIGQALYNGKANNIWTAKGQMQRIPHLLNTMKINKNTAVLENGVYTAYVGSFIGGPIYIRNKSVTFTATISGGVTYSHFILGYTTREEFEANAQSSTPYFDLEVWHNGVLHSGPKINAKNFSYDDIYKVAVLWDKVASVTTTGSSQGIVFLYEPFVAAGAAVAFPGQGSVNCPSGWMSSALNYNSIVSSGAWGNFHEYHHNFQGYGVGNGGEVTNNGMTLVSYALFTKISANRGISSYGAAGLGGWNNYTSATLALEEVLKIRRPDENPSNGNQGLALYATLLHNFGPDNYIQAKYRQQIGKYGQTYTGYLRAWQEITHNDMTYYFKDLLKGIDDSVAGNWGNPEYPMFVPVSSVYQTGRSYNYDGQKKYINTMQPYVIPFGKEFKIDLSKYSSPNGQYASGSVVIPEEFNYTIKSISQPEHGSIEQIDDYNFIYHPDTNNLDSGEIIATLSITKDDNAFTVEDVDLVLQFEQSHETNKTTLTRKTYTYSADNMYTDAQTAYESGYEGYTEVTEEDHFNPTQNCNTDIWYYPDNDATHNKYPNAPDKYFVKDNTINELHGKLYFEDAGKYRIYLRGRMNCAMYYSVDGGKTYTLGATIKDSSVIGNSAQFRPNDDRTYVDLELEEHSWVYFKEVLIVQSSPTVGYIGLGTAKWTEPMFTMTVDENGVTHYFDYQGNEVTEEEANNAELIPPTKANYVNAYRHDYEFPSNAGFTTDYFYTRKYNYTYNDLKVFDEKQTCIESQYQPWDSSSSFSIDNLFDDDDNTFIHTNKTSISENNPFIATVKLDNPVTANRLVFHGSAVKSSYSTYLPKAFKIWVSEDGENWTQVYETAGSKLGKLQVVADFDEYHTFSYYKVEVTDTHSTGYQKYLCLNKIELSSILTIPNGNDICPDNSMFKYAGNWKGEQAFSTFGHIYIGQKGATMSFDFTGTRVGFISSSEFGRNFEVYIDGKKADSIELKEDNGIYSVSYMSQKLAEGTHRVEIRCTGEANIDSILTYA